MGKLEGFQGISVISLKWTLGAILIGVSHLIAMLSAGERGKIILLLFCSKALLFCTREYLRM